MDRLRRDDIGNARDTPAETKLRQALEVMKLGIEMKRCQLRARFANATEHDVEQRLLAWLAEAR